MESILEFVLPRVREGHELEDSIRYGGGFGLVVYGIYDATCGAVLAGWDHQLAVQDIAWGAFVYTAAAYVGSRYRRSCP